MNAHSSADRPGWLGRLALGPVVLVFGGLFWLDSATRFWLAPAAPATPGEAKAVAGAAVAADETALWQLVENSGRAPETVWLDLFISADAATAAAAAGVHLGERDLVRSIPDAAWGVGGQAAIYRAQAVQINDGRQQRLVDTWQPTVADLLAEQQIELGEQDKIEPGLTAALQTASPDVPVILTITRVQETTVVVKESIPVTVSYQDDATLEKGTEKILVEGSAGQKALTYLVRRENGIEVRRMLQSTETTRPMKPRLIARGTKVVVYASGQATWYDSARTMAASYNSLPRWTRVRVVNTQNGKSVVVTIEGGGVAGSTIDLSRDAFSQLGNLGAGRLPVRVEKVYD